MSGKRIEIEFAPASFGLLPSDRNEFMRQIKSELMGRKLPRSASATAKLVEKLVAKVSAEIRRRGGREQ